MSPKAEHTLRVVAYALCYAIAITALVIFGPSDPHVFIYQEF